VVTVFLHGLNTFKQNLQLHILLRFLSKSQLQFEIVLATTAQQRDSQTQAAKRNGVDYGRIFYGGAEGAKCATIQEHDRQSPSTSAESARQHGLRVRLIDARQTELNLEILFETMGQCHVGMSRADPHPDT